MSDFYWSPMTLSPCTPRFDHHVPFYNLGAISYKMISNITDLPNDIFLLIIRHLSPNELILNRRVSKAFYAAFTDDDLNRNALLQHFPRSRELRQLRASPPSAETPTWANTFAKVASRYHHLLNGSPRRIDSFRMCRSFVVPSWARNYPVAPWQRHLQFEDKTSPFHYPDTLWTYDDGLLIFPCMDNQSYVLYDLAERSIFLLDVENEGHIVRRIRLKDRVLVVEWCENEAYHQLNENEMVYRHFATAFDIVRVENVQWRAVFRNEWKIHFLGLPLNSQDRFFSAHTRTHYALYLWQPNRGAWGEDQPIEALAIWDISTPSVYQPSLDPSGALRPAESEGPQVLRRFSFSDLDFYDIRQGPLPLLQRLEIDDGNVYMIEEDHRWIVGQQAGNVLPKLHNVKTIGIPFDVGPRWQDQCRANGDANLSFCDRPSDVRAPGIAPCWRHEEFPYLTIAEACDWEAGVCYSARQCFVLETIDISIQPKIDMSGPGYDIALKDDLWGQLLAKGKICGDERWLIGENTKGDVVVLSFDGP